MQRQHHRRSDRNQDVFVVVVQQLLNAGIGFDLKFHATRLVHMVHVPCNDDDVVVVAVVVVDLYSASRSASNALIVPTALRKDESPI